MAIEGPLRELGIHDVFQLLDLSRKTGLLRVTSELRHNAGTIYFEDGKIIFAEIRSNPHPLADLARATAMQRAGDKRRVGEILVAHGIVTPRDIDRFMRQQIETVVFDLMSWSEGFFSFTEEPPRPIQKDIAVRVSTESLLMEGARRIDEWSRMADKIPDSRVVPRKVNGQREFVVVHAPTNREIKGTKYLEGAVRMLFFHKGRLGYL